MAEDRVQRRLAAIFAADVVGYSRLMREDEAGTLAQLKTLRKEVFDPKTAEHNGRIFNTSGDGVLVEFASVVDAVQHALDVQRTLARRNADVPADRRIELRIGINLGDIIGDGEDVYGDGVNVASRLESLAEPGGIYVSGTVYESVRNTVAADFEDLGERTVKNIDRPIRVISVSLNSVEAESVGTLARPIAARHDSEPSTRVTIAVLPFENLGRGSDDETLCDGMTEDIITALSHINELSVVSRTSSMAYKGRSLDIRTIGQELDAAYVLEGSIRRSGERLRITAQLIDIATGHHIWAERFDRDLLDVFTLQDEITANIGSSLQLTLVEGSLARAWRRATHDPDAWLCLLRARSRQRQVTKASFATAVELLRDATDKDPGSAILCAHLAFTLCLTARHGWADDPGFTLREAEDLVKRAITLDDTLAVAYTYASYVHVALLRHDEAIAFGRRALELDPNDAEGAVSLALAVMTDGRPAEALPLWINAYRLYPIAPAAPQTYFADCYRLLGRLEEALALVLKVRDQHPEMYLSHLNSALIHGQLGRLDEARIDVAALLETDPEYGLRRIPLLFNYRDRGAVDDVIATLREVGLPE